MSKTTQNAQEINNFNNMAMEWWNESGPMKPLHKLNPVRIKYLRDQICRHYKKDPYVTAPLKDLKILDVGCGGGLVCEPLTRLGASVTGVDAAPDNIKIAQDHAEKNDLEISYINKAVEELSPSQGKYDVILALEILEHVENVPFFIEHCQKLLKKNGLLIISTLNRNPKSYMLGIVAAEYLLRWVPRGTHQWKKFLKPSEIARHAQTYGLSPIDVTGLVYSPLRREFLLSPHDLDVNYFMTLTKN